MSQPSQTNVARRSGFTLLELMISIALVLILILGVNTVFSMTAQTVSAGNALGTIYRANQSFHGVIYQDFKSMLVGNEAPCFVIQCQRRYAFRNAADRDADRDGQPGTFDFNGDGDENDPGESVTFFTLNHRNHRIDKLCFFARGKFHRQTGSGTRFWDPDPTNTSIPLSSDEAWIKYGFLSLPDNGSPTMYAQPADERTTPRDFTNPVGNPRNHYATQWVLGRMAVLLVHDHSSFAGGVYSGTPSSTEPLHPIDPITQARGEQSPFQETRYDVAITRISDYRLQVQGIPANTTTFRQQYWFLHGDFYIRGNTELTRPLTSESVARALPVFVPACTQFVVEYAGDFIAQNPDGTGADRHPDGILDFMVDGTAATAVRKTRWYGYPRDLDGNGVIDRRFDVVPVSETFTGTPTLFSWERSRTINRYVVGWGADGATVGAPRPTMLRVTITVDDAASRVGGGETFEYVGTVQ
jgi:prepilin-type N-terminal cleavage/methylation domain-containing protein